MKKKEMSYERLIAEDEMFEKRFQSDLKFLKCMRIVNGVLGFIIIFLLIVRISRS